MHCRLDINVQVLGAEAAMLRGLTVEAQLFKDNINAAGRLLQPCGFPSCSAHQSDMFEEAQDITCLRKGRPTHKSRAHAGAAMSRVLNWVVRVCAAPLQAAPCHTLPISQSALLQAAPHCAQLGCSCRTCSPALQSVCIMRQGHGRRPLHRRAWQQDAPRSRLHVLCCLWACMQSVP